MAHDGRNMPPVSSVTDRLPAVIGSEASRSHQRLVGAVRTILEAIGEDPDREGLAGTPDRVARWWMEFVGFDPGNTDTTFEAVHTDQVVAVTGVRVYSVCEHHLLPFWVDLTMAYIAADRVIGLSKFGRIAHGHAHRPQIQERLVTEVADDIARLAGTDDVAVIGAGEHLCMTMRGIRTPHRMKSSVMRGRFREFGPARAEVMSLADT